MPYTIHAFDGIEFSQLEARANMGTGSALTSFQQLPGGNFYDNYGSADSPQGIRPITFTGVYLSTTAASRVSTMDDLRSKLGVRGKLSILLDDDSLRWQWARLIDVDIPRDTNFPVSAFTFNLTFTTVAQIWYGVITTSEEWSLGDLAWTLGDGTAELGEAGLSLPFTARDGAINGLTVDTAGTQVGLYPINNGNRVATNLSITITANDTTIPAVHFSNATSGYSWAYEPSTALTGGSSVTINMGAMSIVHSVDGNDYANFTPSNAAIWDQLEVGQNDITMTAEGNSNYDSTIVVEFYDHYK